MIGNTNWTSASLRVMDFQIDEAYVQGADSQQGITGASELWYLNSEHLLSEKGQEEFRKLDKEGKIDTGSYYRAREEDKEKIQ